MKGRNEYRTRNRGERSSSRERIKQKEPREMRIERKEREEPSEEIIEFYDDEILDQQHYTMEIYKGIKKRNQQDHWIDTQMKSSGIQSSTNQYQSNGIIDDEIEFDEEEIIKAKNIIPKFMKDYGSTMTKSKSIMPIRNPNSKIAKISQKGSEIIRIHKEKKERMKQTRQMMEDDTIHKPMNNQENQMKELNEIKKEEIVIKEMKPDFITQRQEMKRIRESLPIYQKREEIINTIRENQIVLIIGETGSGKTTQIVQYLYENKLIHNGKIGCTQPRRVATVSVCQRVGNEMNKRIGDEIEYSIRFEDKTSEKTKIKFMTDGILIREILRDPLLNEYGIIIMDEVHERSINTDILFGMMKEIMKERNDIKLVITSATINEKQIIEYFGMIPIINVEGRMHEVKVKYLKYDPDDYVEMVTKQILYIHKTHDKGDILVFLTGQEDIEMTKEILKEKLETLGERLEPIEIIPIYSQLSNEAQNKIFEKSEKRKVILSTNIAETSLTIPGIKYVIDTGLGKWKVYNSTIGMDMLRIFPETKQNAEQRRGRAGRIENGICYRMYTERTYKDDFLDIPIPEIQRSNLNTVLLQLKSIGIHNIREFPLMDKPNEENIMNSLYELWLIGAIDEEERITPLGKEIVEYPLEPTMSKMIITSIKYRCVREIVIIVSMLNIPNIFIQSKYQDEKKERIKEKFYQPDSDHITMINIYNQWKLHRNDRTWNEMNMINMKAMNKVREIKKQINEILKKKRINTKMSCGDNLDQIKRCITECYFYNSVRLNGNQYQNLRTGVNCYIHPTSTLYQVGLKPTYIIYHELLLTNQSYMKCVTSINGKWLLDLLPDFFVSFSSLN